MVNIFEIDLIIERAMAAFNAKNQEHLSELFGISPSDFSRRKKRGTLIKLIEKESFRRGISYDWIKTGQGSMTGGHGVGTQIKETTAPYGSDDTSSPRPKISDLLSKTAAVLESKSIFSNALTSNIEAFHEAINLQTKLADHESMMKEQEARLKTVEDRLYSVEQKDKAG